MDVPLESLRNKVTIFFGKVFEMAANRSFWWYGIRLDASDPDSLAQLCEINNIRLETMFDACKFNRDVLTNFAQVTEGKPAAFMKKHTCSRRLELVPYMRE
jgi:hypothetical protein